jgi:formylglycine-generating enzyme required for sulfatase activity
MKPKRITYGFIGVLCFISLSLLLCCSALAQKQPKPGQVWKDPVLGMEFVWVPGGCYEMGCGSWTSDCELNEKPAHTVCVDGFWMGKYEVTQGQWKRLMGNNPSHFKGCGDNCPVEMVLWDEAVKFAGRLSQRTGYTFRLPTEAEWEYACRSGGRKEKYSGGGDVDAVAWYDGNRQRGVQGWTQPVGSKRSNGLGIYDMSGNVLEWCGDWYEDHYYSRSPRNNPQGPSSGAGRVVRGGSWNLGAGWARCGGIRDGSIVQGDGLGFRLVRVGR